MTVPQHEVIIVGGGFSGIGAAIKLDRTGISDYLLVEQGDGIGGAWHFNTYPGVAVDIPSLSYSFSFERNPDWSRVFAPGAELTASAEHCVDKYGIRGRIRLNTGITGARFDEQTDLWHLSTSSGETLTARHVIGATGVLTQPKLPEIPGIASFGGVTMHTARWDHGVDLRGKRVAIIGSGASAAQVIPAIAPKLGKLHVFQRTPHWVLPRPDRVFKPWQRALLGNKLIYKMLRTAIYWELELRMLGFKYSKLGLHLVAQRPALQHIKAQLKDPKMQAAVTPDFTIGCKRIILSSTLYPALARANVMLHTKDDGIAEINEHGILTAKGEQIDLDCIVYSTGYDATDGVISYPVIGKGGKSVQDFWAEFPRAYLGTTMPGFPNLFVVTGPNTGIGHTSAIFVIEAQMEYIARAIAATEKKGAKTIEVTTQAEADYTGMIHREMKKTVWHWGGCNSWYKSKSGHVIAMFPGFSFTFRQMCKAFKPAHHRFS